MYGGYAWIRVKVVNEEGLYDIAKADFYVEGLRPIAKVTGPTEVYAGEEYTWSAEESYDPDNLEGEGSGITDYKWGVCAERGGFISGSCGTITFNKEFEEEGCNYSKWIGLEVTDDDAGDQLLATRKNKDYLCVKIITKKNDSNGISSSISSSVGVTNVISLTSNTNTNSNSHFNSFANNLIDKISSFISSQSSNTNEDSSNCNDWDGIPYSEDNCPYCWNPLQIDSDDDGVGNKCDNCKYTYNPDQEDSDGDGIGDACDSSNSSGSAPSDASSASSSATLLGGSSSNS